MIQIENNKNLLRDAKSRAIINNDSSSYKSRLKQIKKNQEKEQEISNLRNEIADLKNLVLTLVNQQQVQSDKP